MTGCASTVFFVAKHLARGRNMSKPYSVRWLQQSIFLNYGVAVLSVTAAQFIAQWLQIQYDFEPLVPFLCAIMFSAWFGGVNPGLLAVALSLLAFHYYFLIPMYPLGMEKEIPRLLFAALISGFIVVLSAAQRSAIISDCADGLPPEQQAALVAALPAFETLAEALRATVQRGRRQLASENPEPG